MSIRSDVRRLFRPGTPAESRRVADILRKEMVGGALLLAAALAALVWANSPWSHAYLTLRDTQLGTDFWHLRLTLAGWTAELLLAVFFFVAGLELKREFVAGDLRQPSRAALPVAGAIGGMAVPALIYVVVNAGAGDHLRGWAVPTATDIAFALAVLAVVSTHLPSGLRAFLLSLAVIDDLIAIVIIAVFFTSDLAPLPLLGALVPLAAFAVLVQRRVRSWWLLLPLAGATWILIHASGVHATVAGIALGFAVPALRSERAGGPDAGPGLAEHFEHLVRPLSAGVAVPVFAFFAAGVDFGGASALGAALRDTITLGIGAGLVLGKLIGIGGATWLVARFTRAELDENLTWADVVGVALLGGVGFTVSLLLGDLAFGAAPSALQHAKVGVLVGSVASAAIAATILRARNRAYRRIATRN